MGFEANHHLLLETPSGQQEGGHEEGDLLPPHLSTIALVSPIWSRHAVDLDSQTEGQGNRHRRPP